ncbi:hypothetical protein QTG54_013132 [Skeletonema marinoi]|uniref:Uncharacterized protein n=1 Tax=Skeletonema marinoi TaxID=267567 RepID=A0AAD8XY29_9STRA|nr:hypothetical protein QTG54_013132 [Skeletonema marinoi]
MEGSLADSEFGGGGGRSSIVKRKSSRSNSIVFKTVPEISHFIESSEDDSSADGSLALDELDETHRTPQPIIPSRSSSSIASPSQRRNVSDTQKTTVFSAVSRFAKHMSSLGFQSTSEEVSPNSNVGCRRHLCACGIGRSLQIQTGGPPVYLRVLRRHLLFPVVNNPLRRTVCRMGKSTR